MRATSKVSISPQIEKEAARWYEANFANRNAGAICALHIFPMLIETTIVRELRGVFEFNELMVILEIETGTTDNIVSAATAQIPSVGLKDKFRDSDLRPIAIKWNVDAKSMLDRINTLTFCQELALRMWACVFWTWHQLSQEDNEFVRRYVSKMLQPYQKGYLPQKVFESPLDNLIDLKDKSLKSIK